jgi:hypothetical protein
VAQLSNCKGRTQVITDKEGKFNRLNKEEKKKL